MSPTEVPSIERLYETILERSALPLPGFEDVAKDRAWRKASRIRDYLHDRADRLDEDCILCHEKKARQSHTRCVYDTPWDNEESEKPFCREECGDAYLYGGDFAYFWCEFVWP